MSRCGRATWAFGCESGAGGRERQGEAGKETSGEGQVALRKRRCARSPVLSLIPYVRPADERFSSADRTSSATQRSTLPPSLA